MTPLESFTSGRPHPVDFTAIERELAGLWKEATAPGEDGATAPGEDGAAAPGALTRACQLNLVVWCAAGEETSRATSIVAQVVRVHPSRVLMAVLDRTQAAAKIEAFISAHCSYQPGAGRGKQVCCEQVTIAATLGAAERLPGAVLPLLLPDLPVVLWWAGDADLADPASRRLAEAADRVVLDARRMADAAAQLGRAASLDRPVSDLAWHRLRGWRDLTAGLFDGRAFADYPARLDTIEVEYAGGPARCAESLLLGSWAATRLRWRPVAGTAGRAGTAGVARAAGTGGAGEPPVFAFTRPDGGTGALRLTPRAQQQPAGRILSFTMQAGEASFSLRRERGAECVRVTVDLPGASPPARVARVTPRDDATLLSRCLEAGGRDDLYEQALRMAARLLAPAGPPGAPDATGGGERRA